MPSKLEVAITSLDVLVPIAEAVPFLGAPVKGSREATKKILKYAQVSGYSSAAYFRYFNVSRRLLGCS